MKKVNSFWNILMEYAGTPFTVFIFLSWYTGMGHNNATVISLLFALAVIITAASPQVAALEAVLGVIILFGCRQIFMIPISAPWMVKPFCWFNQPTACAGVAAFLVVKGFLYLYTKITSK